MKRYIRSATVPSTEQYFAEVEPEDLDVIKQLMSIRSNFNGPLIKLPSSRNDLGKTDNYDIEDKCIHLRKQLDDCRVYTVPYTRNFPWRGGVNVFTVSLYIYDDKSFKFGDNGKVRTFGSVADATLFNDFNKAMY